MAKDACNCSSPLAGSPVYEEFSRDMIKVVHVLKFYFSGMLRNNMRDGKAMFPIAGRDPFHCLMPFRIKDVGRWTCVWIGGLEWIKSDNTENQRFEPWRPYEGKVGSQLKGEKKRDKKPNKKREKKPKKKSRKFNSRLADGSMTREKNKTTHKNTKETRAPVIIHEAIYKQSRLRWWVVGSGKSFPPHYHDSSLPPK